jgi:predicted dehydrogenase
MNWGIIGLGKIAHKFAESIQLSSNARLWAVASRDITKATVFSQQYHVPYACGSYEELLSIKNLDAVYIATPHSEHHAHVFLCLQAGIPVLCEKAFASNARQVTEMIQLAEEKEVFLMEAIWTRFLPAIEQTLAIVTSGVLGEIVHVEADFGFFAPYNPSGRLFNPTLAGGSLLDIGIYPVFISKLLLGQPQSIKAIGTLSPEGVDISCNILMQWSNGATAQLYSTLATRTDSTCTIYGTNGKLTLNSRFHEADGITLTLHGKTPLYIPCEKRGLGYVYEIDHVEECLRNNATQSPLLPLSFSLELIKLLDEIRSQIGVKYPADE